MSLHARLWWAARCAGGAEALGVNPDALRRWRRGATLPRLEMVLAIGELAGFTTDFLLTGRTSPPETPAAILEAADRMGADTLASRLAAVVEGVGGHKALLGRVPEIRPRIVLYWRRGVHTPGTAAVAALAERVPIDADWVLGAKTEGRVAHWIELPEHAPPPRRDSLERA